jgi:ABC-type cobalamin/Fe3+-siderophores transport system ATPase subunit
MHDLNLVLRTATRALALGEGAMGRGSVVVGEGDVREVVTAERMAALFGARFEMVGEAGVQALVATGAAGDGAGDRAGDRAVVGRVGSGHV